jgi:2-polyprenyl-3-methyl-5-hydroxy-6-metoxy-1,4-benzoquinol methylase
MNSIVREKCAICNNIIEKIFELEHIPITLSCSASLEKYNYGKLSFSKCKTCSTIQLNELIPLNILYEKSHNFTSVGKIWSDYFKCLVEKLQTNITDKNVLEIGCPSGKLAMNNINYNKWYIVDLNKNNSIKFNDKIHFIQGCFDKNFQINDRIDVITHSHLFEHIYEPNDFLKKCYELLVDDGEMIFGIPNMKYLADNDLCLFLGIFFEHTIFMNKENVIYLLKKHGFDIVEIIDYLNHSTIYHVKKTKQLNTLLNIAHSNELQITDYFEKFMSGINKYKLFIDDCNLIICNTNKPVYIFAASYNTQILLSMGIEIKYLKGILDNAKDKENTYLYGFELLVYSPDVIINNDSIVILKNSFYGDEIKEQLLTLNPRTQILM